MSDQPQRQDEGFVDGLDCPGEARELDLELGAARRGSLKSP